MDRGRLAFLKEKRKGEGLRADEANELGRLLAEEAGEPYANAKSAGYAERAQRESAEAEYRDAVVAQELAEGVNRGLWKADPVDPDRRHET
jgi:hypothetical protein